MVNNAELFGLCKLAYREHPGEPQYGDLRVYWYPQVPCTPFHWYVKDLVEAKTVLSLLASYDAFQLLERIKGEYANAGSLEVYVGERDDQDRGFDGWEEWSLPGQEHESLSGFIYNEGDNIDKLTMEQAIELTNNPHFKRWYTQEECL